MSDECNNKRPPVQVRDIIILIKKNFIKNTKCRFFFDYIFNQYMYINEFF